MPNKSLLCIVHSKHQADAIVQRLQSIGFSHDDFSVLFADSNAREGAAVGAGTGGLVGGSLGWMIGAGLVSLPVTGPFIAVGSLLAAVAGVAVGASAGGIVGGLIGLGVPEFHAQEFEGKLLSGRILMSVHTKDDEQHKKALEILVDGAAEDICTTGEMGASGPIENADASASENFVDYDPDGVDG